MPRTTLLAMLIGFVGGTTLLADEPPLPEREAEPELAPVPDPERPDAGAPILLPFRETPLAAVPEPGFGTPAPGYPHYDLPSRHYGPWFRPDSFGRGPAERCRPTEFNPRGYGNLFARSRLPHRVEYHPAVLDDPRTPYGPSYAIHPAEYNCCHVGKGWTGCGQCGLCGLCGHCRRDDCRDGDSRQSENRWTAWLRGDRECGD